MIVPRGNAPKNILYWSPNNVKKTIFETAFFIKQLITTICLRCFALLWSTCHKHMSKKQKQGVQACKQLGTWVFAFACSLITLG
jgi:hypothetical protein